jgi:hypothetical protein
MPELARLIMRLIKPQYVESLLSYDDLFSEFLERPVGIVAAMMTGRPAV